MKRGGVFSIIVLLAVYVGCLYYAGSVESLGDIVRASDVTVQGGEYVLTGRIYVPRGAHPDNPVPAVLLAHGISGSKEMMSAISLELAREGLVALTIDLLGHGGSRGSMSSGDPSFGVETAYNYLRSLDYVDRELLGLVGHSLGAGAVKYVMAGEGIRSVVFIGGGLGGMTERGLNPNMDLVSPPNLLVAVGRHDVLFEEDELKSSLVDVFGAVPVEGITYGVTIEGTGRRLSMPPTTHLLEPVDPLIVGETVAWMKDCLAEDSSPAKHRVYQLRDVALGLAAVALIIIVLPLSRLLPARSAIEAVGLQASEVLVISVLGLALFIPTMGAGALLSFPPLLFGSALAWWHLLTAIIGFLLLRFVLKSEFELGTLIKSLRLEDLWPALAIFGFLFLVAAVTESLTGLTPRIIAPIFRFPTSTTRLALLPAFLPFYLVYMAFESRLFHGWGRSELPGLARMVAAKVGPYLVVLLLQYGGMYLFDVRLLPGFAAFFLEFLWLIVPILILSTFFTWWFQGRGLWTAVFLNSLFYSWFTVSIFPFA